jgi:hypothetical protein
MRFRHVAGWVLFWGAAAALSTSALVFAFNPQPDPPGHYYGLMTVQRGQHMSLHVSNTKMAVDAFRPANSMCAAELRIVDACGQTLARNGSRLSPGESLSLNFTLPAELPPDPCGDPPGDIGAGDPPGGSDPPSGIGAADPPTEFDPPAPIRVRAQIVFTGPAGHCVSSLEVGDPFITGHGTGGGGGSGFIHPGMIVGFNPQPDPPGAPTKSLR